MEGGIGAPAGSGVEGEARARGACAEAKPLVARGGVGIDGIGVIGVGGVGSSKGGATGAGSVPGRRALVTLADVLVGACRPAPPTPGCWGGQSRSPCSRR